MKYYLIVGEASGDLHASRLMRALKTEDPKAEFRFFGGDLMAAEGGVRVKHFKELAYMGFVPVLLHLRTIFRNMSHCKRDIVSWAPDAVILVDYPGFNLNIAKFVRSRTQIPVFYYISPKIWAWKEWRIRAIRRDVTALFSILPFEVPFFEQKHHYKIHYVGNPTAEEVMQFRKNYDETFGQFVTRQNALNPSSRPLETDRPVIALLAGSRRQEIRDNLPAMLEAARSFPDCQPVLAGAPSIDDSFYAQMMAGEKVALVRNETYALLSHARASLVTSGTATLETALFKLSTPVVLENGQVSKEIRTYGAKFVEVNSTYSIVSMEGMTEEINALYKHLKVLDCILQFVHSGSIAVTKSTREFVTEYLARRACEVEK